MEEHIDPFHGTVAEHIFTARDNRTRTGSFDYYRGANGLIFIGKIPSDLARYYEAGFQPIPRDAAELSRVAETERFKIEQLKRFVPGGRYLEIGPWIGMAAYIASRSGFDVTALEMNEECVALMRSAGMDARVCVDPAAWLRAADETFDAIVLWHSIEHLPEPWNVIDAAIDRLRPGGIILIATPNPESAQARHFGARWFHLDAPRHLYLLPAPMIAAIGRGKGLTIEEQTTDDRLSMMLDRQGWEWPMIRHVIRMPFGRSRAGTFAVAVGALLARKRRKGDDDGAAYTIVMRKPAEGVSPT